MAGATYRLAERFNWWEWGLSLFWLWTTGKGSNRRKKRLKRLAKAHQKVANQRKDFHYKIAKKRKHIGYEALNIKGIARTKLAKSTYSAGWKQFPQILSVKAESHRSEFKRHKSRVFWVRS